MKISRIEQEFNYGKYNIVLFGYDNDGNFIKQKKPFLDYFYYKHDSLSDLDGYAGKLIEDTKVYNSIYGEPVVKVHYKSIKQKNEITKKYKDKIYCSDIQPAHKFLLDEKLEWSNKRNILYFDIETMYNEKDQKANSPGRAEMPITSITGYSSLNKKYYVLSWHPSLKNLPEIKTKQNSDTMFVFCRNEREVINGFISLIHENKIDIISGWYSAGYDLPYIMNRMKNLGMEINDISPMCYAKIYRKGDKFNCYINGLDHVDLLEAVKDFNFTLPNFKLDTAAKNILKNKDMVKLTEVTWRDWEDNYKGFLQYAIRDVELLHKIDEALGIFPTYIRLQRIAGLPKLNTVLFKSSVIDHYLMKEYWNDKIMSNKGFGRHQPYAGAIVINPKEPGLHRNVVVFDYASLYPTTAMAFNISPETFIISQTQADELGINIDKDVLPQLKAEGKDFIDTGYSDDLFGKRYIFLSQTAQTGVYPHSLKKLYEQRVKIKKHLSVNWNNLTEDERNALDREQYVIKIVLNSAYGALGFSYFRLFRPECADAITYFARKSLLFAMDKFENEYHKKVQYCDTDSVFILNGKDSDEDLINKSVNFNTELKQDIVKKYNPAMPDDYFLMNLEYEKTLDYAYFGDNKKRYYTILPNGSRYIRGINIIRKDTPEFMKKSLDKMAELAVKEKLTKTHFIEMRKLIEKVPYTQLGIPKSFTKRFDEYNKTVPQHVKAAKFANKHLEININNTDIPYLFYIKSNCEDDLKVRDRQKAICLNEEDLKVIGKRNDIFELDYDTFFNKQVIDQLDEFNKISSVNEALIQYKEYVKNGK